MKIYIPIPFTRGQKTPAEHSKTGKDEYFRWWIYIQWYRKFFEILLVNSIGKGKGYLANYKKII